MLISDFVKEGSRLDRLIVIFGLIEVTRNMMEGSHMRPSLDIEVTWRMHLILELG